MTTFTAVEVTVQRPLWIEAVAVLNVQIQPAPLVTKIQPYADDLRQGNLPGGAHTQF